MKKCPWYLLSVVFILSSIRARKQRAIKCAVLSESQCLQEESCHWYEEAGCRNPCNFHTKDGCNYFPEQCSFSDDQQTCEVRYPTNSPSSNPSSSPVITQSPTEIPTSYPTQYPTKYPSMETHPTNSPTDYPTAKPTHSPIPTQKPTKTPTNYPTGYPTKKPTYAPFEAQDPAGFVLQIHVFNSLVYKNFQNDIDAGMKFAMEEHKLSDDPDFQPSITQSFCYSKFINDENIADSTLCHRFQHFVNKPHYKTVEEDSEVKGYTIALEVTNVLFHRPSLIPSTWKNVQGFFDQNNIPIKVIDFHAAVTYGRQAIVRKIPEKKPNIVFLLADDLGWADVGEKAEAALSTLSKEEQGKCGIIFDEMVKEYSWKETCVELLSEEECYQTCRQVKLHFYGSIIAMDEQIGRVLEILKTRENNGNIFYLFEELGRSIYDNTIIFFGSDNGSARFDASGDTKFVAPSSKGHLREWKFSPYEGGTRVPFILHYPALIKENLHISTPASSYDLLPTVMELMEVEYDQDKTLDGISLFSIIHSYQAFEGTQFFF
eukprot:maker-scaffold_18-augustus-gene-3.46-mRNA-1 protein AED:0.76 eAED:0.76 QI:0/0/0/0.5/0/0.5/2/0/543